jgi:uncharacterized protein (DUF1810 family)
MRHDGPSCPATEGAVLGSVPTRRGRRRTRRHDSGCAACPPLGRRLVESARALTDLDIGDPVQVFGPVDEQKLRSSMTLFAVAVPDEPVFRQVLDHYFGGEEDDATTSRL